MAIHSRPVPPYGSPDFDSSSPKDRILDVADYLFYNDGAHHTSVKQILKMAGVSSRQFAQHFRSKDALILAYIENRHQRDVALMESTRSSGLSEQGVLETVLDEIIADLNTPGFHGCAFANMAAEYPDDPSVQAALRAHRDWYVAAATALLRGTGHPLPADAADDLILARDGAMSSWYSGDPVSTTATLRRAIDRVLVAIPCESELATAVIRRSTL